MTCGITKEIKEQRNPQNVSLTVRLNRWQSVASKIMKCYAQVELQRKSMLKHNVQIYTGRILKPLLPVFWLMCWNESNATFSVLHLIYFKVQTIRKTSLDVREGPQSSHYNNMSFWIFRNFTYPEKWFTDMRFKFVYWNLSNFESVFCVSVLLQKTCFIV